MRQEDETAITAADAANNKSGDLRPLITDQSSLSDR